MLVIAGAGSGKTRVITHKIAHLIRRHQVDPAHIFAITFTNKAAREMRSRVGELLAKNATRKPQISTYHTLGLRIIRAEIATLGYRPGFSIHGEGDSLSLLTDIGRRSLGQSAPAIELIRAQIGRWKSELIAPPQAAKLAGADSLLAAAATCYHEYAETLRTYNAFDFDDLIMLPTVLLRDDLAARGRWQDQVRYLMIDEYQDTNSCQYELARLLAGERGELTAVGDDDQSIYAWRGARPENLALLQRDYPQLRVIKLEQNYRSSGTILKAANQLIENNSHVIQKKLWCRLGFGDPIRVLTVEDEQQEAIRIADLIVHQNLLHKRSFDDFAILYRGNYQARPFEQALRERRIPYSVSGGPSFFDYTEVKDVMAYLRLLVNPDDDNAFLRVINTPRRSIGLQTIARLLEFAQCNQASLFGACSLPELVESLSGSVNRKLAEFSAWLSALVADIDPNAPVTIVRQLLRDIDYEHWLTGISENENEALRRWQNVNELLGWMDRLHAGDSSLRLDELVTRLMISDITERDDEQGDGVRLMTLHAAKGLEFPHVFIAGMEEGILPHQASIDAETIEEERRLAYVGITRAQQTLTLTLAGQRKRFGRMLKCEPSRFLAELPQDDLRWSGAEQSGERDRDAGRQTLQSLKAKLQQT